jgi:diguanylate cyclase (GGDEF)-like protein
MSSSNSNSDSQSEPTAIRWRNKIEVSVPPCLVVIYGAELGLRLALADQRVSLGRSPTCDLVVDVDDVSRNHCQIIPHDRGYLLRDLGSTNGTWLDDRNIESGEEAPLRSGARIRIGSLILKYLEGNDVEALYHEEIYRLTIVDGLTGLHNRRYFDEFLSREMARAERHERPLSLVLFDLDGFKAINDQHGHPGGDEVLQQFGEALLKTIRQESCLARMSGDEFAVVLPETTLAKARMFAERLRAAVESTDFRVADANLRDPLTISIGLAEMTDLGMTRAHW